MRHKAFEVDTDAVLEDLERHIASVIRKFGTEYFLRNCCRTEDNKQYALHINRKYN